MKEIFCTIGPTSLNNNFFKGIKNSRVSIIRINLSHTKIIDLKKIISKIRKKTTIPICLDTEGAQIRTLFKKRKFLKKNKIIKIDNNLSSNYLSLYPNIFKQIKKNFVLDVGFENLKIKIIKNKNNYLLGKVISSGYLDNNKGIHIVGHKISLPPLTEKDIEAIKIGKKLNIKHFALSFTNSPKDVLFFNKMLPNSYKIFKIETKNGVKNLNSILKLSDNILIDRGDLSKDIDLMNVPSVQRKIQKLATKRKKNVFVATNLLESMIENSYPTRAEINDIYNCLELGASGLVLAAETAVGKWPLKCVDMLSSVIQTFEKDNKKKGN
jgi:pyruvate kinase